MKKTSEDIKKYKLTRIKRSLNQEIKLAKKFWANYPLEKYYQDFQPQTNLILKVIKNINFKNILEFGSNVGRNLYWIKKQHPKSRILGIDINKKAIKKGCQLFKFKPQELIFGDENYLKKIPTNSFDIIFTVSTLSHLPTIKDVLAQFIRIARKRVFLIELVFPQEGTFTSKEVVPFSHAHNYLKIFKNLKIKLISQKKAPLGKGILKYYWLYELKPDNASLLSNFKCPVCSETKWRFFFQRMDGLFLYQCLACSVYISENLWLNCPEQYEKRYFNQKFLDKIRKGYSQYEQSPEFEFYWQFALLKLFAPKAKKIIDLGSGTGKFLEILRLEGIKGQGIDISNFACRIAREKGFEIKTLDLEKDNIPTGNYDVITAWDLIEHLKNPLAFLKKVNQTLNKKGTFIFTTPSADDREKKWFNHSLEHKLYFTEKSLRFLIKKVFNKSEDKSELIRINFGGKKSGFMFSFICLVQKKGKINKNIIELIRKRKLTGKEKVDNYLRTIFAHFFQDSEKDRFFKTKEDLGTLLNLSIKYHFGKWQPADLTLFASHNPYLKSYKIACLKSLYHLTEKKIRSKEKLISHKNKEIKEMQDEYSSKLNKIYQSKTWQLLGFYQAYEKKLKNLTVVSFWQNLLPNLKASLISTLKPINFKTTYTFDLFYFPIIDWHFRFQRSQQICTQLAKNDHRIFYLKPASQIVSNKNLDKQQVAEKVKIKKIASNIFEVTPVSFKKLNIYKDILSSLDKRYLNWSLETVKEKMQIRNNLAMVALPFWYPLLKNQKWQIIYDCLDELSGFSDMSKKIINQEKKLIKQTNFVLFTSQKLLKKYKKLNPNYLLVKNATDFGHFSKKPKKIPTDFKFLKQPIIGYYGAIGDWFDEKLVEYLVLKKPSWQFVFIGHVIGAKIDKLKNLPNVHFLGEKSYKDLPSYLYQFDCFFIPFKLNKLILATNPVKVYEVLASGKQIVSVNLPELQSMKNLLYLAKDKKDFLEKIEKALKENSKTLINQRIDFAKKNTWSHRVKDLMDGINKYIYPKVSLIIISYKTLSYLKKCLKNIYRYSNYPNLELIVVDNGSKDKTADYLNKLKNKDPNLKVILSKKNHGFAGGNNLGIKEATGEYIILLNNDTIATANWVVELIKYLKDPKVGLVGPVTNWIGNEAKVDLGYKNLKQMHKKAKEYTEKHRGKSFEIPMLAFFCVAGRKSLWDKIGLLDERFTIGSFEDDDYCRRVKLAGYKLLCAEDVFIHHFGRATTGKMPEFKKNFPENKKKFEEKWRTKWIPHKYKKI